MAAMSPPRLSAAPLALPAALAPAALTLAALAAAPAAWSQAAPAPARGNEVEGLVVPGGPSPNVTATYPAADAAAPPGVIVLKITFDQAMAPAAWAYAQADGGAFPHCLARPRLLRDKKSFALLCTVDPKQTYALAINTAPRFASDAGRSAKPYVMRFTTTEAETRDLHTALDLAGLKDEDAPIMDWNDTGKGVSQSAPPAAATP
jgi:hypothetical protein